MVFICHALMRVESLFNRISISQILKGVSSLILAIILIIYFGFYGALVATLCSSTVPLWYLGKGMNIDFKFKIDKERIKALFLTGVPISLIFFNSDIFHSLDRILIVKYLNVTQLGYYSLALSVMTMVQNIPSSISYIIYPKMLEVYGKSDRDILSIQRYFNISSQINSIIIAATVGFLVVSIEFAIYYLLSRYIEAVDVVIILSFSTFFMGVEMISVRTLLTEKNFMILTIFQIIGMVLNLLLNIILIKMGYGIEGVAIGTSVAYVIYSSIVYYYTMSKFTKNIYQILINFTKVYWPILWVGIILVTMNKINIFNMDFSRTLWINMGQLVVKILIYFLLTIPLFLMVIKKILKEML